MVYVTRRERFSAAHKLWNSSLSADENVALFDKCANTNYHGHNYILFVTIKGEVSERTGYVMDTKILKQIILDSVISKVDHKNLSLDVPFLQGVNPTTENLLIKFWSILKPFVEENNAQLHRIRLVETENNYADYYGPNTI